MKYTEDRVSSLLHVFCFFVLYCEVDNLRVKEFHDGCYPQDRARLPSKSTWSHSCFAMELMDSTCVHFTQWNIGFRNNFLLAKKKKTKKQKNNQEDLRIKILSVVNSNLLSTFKQHNLKLNLHRCWSIRLKRAKFGLSKWFEYLDFIVRWDDITSIVYTILLWDDCWS